MVKILKNDKNNEAALRTLLEVCYIDLNGPNNTGGTRNPYLLSQFPPFDPKRLAVTYPGIISLVHEICAINNFSKEEVKKMFLDIADINFKSLKLPVVPIEAWNKLSEELFK
jgi:hypothetical protein